MQPEAPGKETAAATVAPLLHAPAPPPVLRHFGPASDGRERLENLIHSVFAQAYAADVRVFCAHLLAFERDDALRGVVGMRPAQEGPFYSENYLDAPVEQRVTALTGQPADRAQLVEIGNLAVPSIGDARWLYAALTAFLHGAGFRWMVCTAVAPLFAGFQRMGFQLRVMSTADATRLGADAAQWGRYYDKQVVVCCGSIDTAAGRLGALVSMRPSAMQQLWRQAMTAGIAFRGGTLPRAEAQ